MWRLIFSLAFVTLAFAETGIQGWLRYAPLPGVNIPHGFLPNSIITLNSSQTSPVLTAGKEVQQALQSIFGKSVGFSSQKSSSSSGTITIGTVEAFTHGGGKLVQPLDLEDDGFWLSVKGNTVQVLGNTERGALYGTFEYLSMLAQGNFSNIAYTTNPNGQIRWVNQ